MSENYNAKIHVLKNPSLKIIGLNEKPLNNEEIVEKLNRQNEEFFDDSCDTKIISVMQMKNTKEKIILI